MVSHGAGCEVLGLLNAFDFQYFQLTMGLSVHNPIISQKDLYLDIEEL